MRKRAACYCRVSTKKDDQLDSLEKQQEFFAGFFERNEDYELYGLYADEGISAKSMRNRRAFQRLLEDAKAGLFEAVFVKDVSRFARNVQDFYHALEILETAGVRVHFVTMGLRSEEASRFTLGLMALLAEDESERLSVKVKFGKNVTAERGRVPNAVFGYDRLDAFTLVPNPQQADWVRRIFAMYAGQGLGAAAIADRLNAAGVRTARGNTGAWTQSAVCKLLKNRLYVGRVANRKSEVVNFRTGRRNVRPPDEWVVVEREEFRLIDDETFERAQRMMAERAGGFGSGTRQSGGHALSNLMRCAEDGRCMRRVARGKKACWVCSVRNARGVAACPNASRVDEADVEAMLRGLTLCALRDDRRAKERIVKKAEQMIASHAGAEIADEQPLREKARRYRELYADGLIGRDELREALAAIDAQTEALEENRRARRQAAAGGEDIARMAEAYLRGERELIDNAFLKRWVEAVEVSQGGAMRLLLRMGTMLQV